jgi:hypothetical protein
MADNDNAKHSGPSAVAAGWGQAQVESNVLSIGGAAVGAAAGAAALAKNAKVISLAENFKTSPKVAGAVVGGLALSAIGSLVGYLHGWVKGSKQAVESRAQFEQLSTSMKEKDKAIEGLNAQLETQKSFVDTLSKERAGTVAHEGPAR